MKYYCCSIDNSELGNLLNPDYTEEDTIQIFKMLSHPLRLKIIRVLLVDNEVCTCDLTELFTEIQPAVTKQLSKMKREGFLTSRKASIKKNEASGNYEKVETENGKWTYYQIAENKKELLEHLLLPFVNQDLVNKKIVSNDDLIIVVS